MIIELDRDEYFNIVNNFLSHGYIFNKMMSRGHIVFSGNAKTIQISYADKYFLLEINKKFWDGSTIQQKMFYIGHEFLHLVFGHLYRMNFIQNNDAYNVAADIVVNHFLINSFNFSRENVDGNNILCWLDTVFSEEEIKSGILAGQSAEYYYNILKDRTISSSSFDNHIPSSMTKEEFNEILKDIYGDSPNAEEINELKGIIKQGGTTAGNTIGSFVEQYNFDYKPKRKWENLIKELSIQELKITEKDNYQWRVKNRRMVLIPDELLLPTIKETDSLSNDIDKIDVYLFLDTSPSCEHLKVRFIKAALSLPKNNFEVHAKSFATAVHNIDLYTTPIKIRSGYGTFFHIMEEAIQSDIKKNVIKKYPSLVFVITDGYGNNITPEYPARWFWFLSQGGSARLIPNKSKTYKLSEFE